LNREDRKEREGFKKFFLAFLACFAVKKEEL